MDSGAGGSGCAQQSSPMMPVAMQKAALIAILRHLLVKCRLDSCPCVSRDDGRASCASRTSCTNEWAVRRLRSTQSRTLLKCKAKLHTIRVNWAYRQTSEIGLDSTQHRKQHFPVKQHREIKLVQSVIKDARANTRSGEIASGSLSYTDVAAGALLFLILVFGTCTVFVREAWALQSFQIGVYAVLAVYLLTSIGRKSEPVNNGWLPRLVYLMPLWGVGQIVAHTTSSSFETRQAILRWGALAGVFFSEPGGHSLRHGAEILSERISMVRVVYSSTLPYPAF